MRTIGQEAPQRRMEPQPISRSHRSRNRRCGRLRDKWNMNRNLPEHRIDINMPVTYALMHEDDNQSAYRPDDPD